MAKKPASEEAPEIEEVATQRDPLIKTVSEVAALTDAEREAFRQAGGTTCNDESI